MSNAEEYAYTFRMIIPGKTEQELARLCDILKELSDRTHRDMAISAGDDYLRLTIGETTAYPEDKVLMAANAAKAALRECGIDAPVFISALATPTEGTNMLAIHKQIVLEVENDTRRDLTDDMYNEELAS